MTGNKAPRSAGFGSSRSCSCSAAVTETKPSPATRKTIMSSAASRKRQKNRFIRSSQNSYPPVEVCTQMGFAPERRVRFFYGQDRSHWCCLNPLSTRRFHPIVSEHGSPKYNDRAVVWCCLVSSPTGFQGEEGGWIPRFKWGSVPGCSTRSRP